MQSSTPTRSSQTDKVSRRRYMREKAAREEAEKLLEIKSRALWDANQELSKQALELEDMVQDRTADLQKATKRAEESSNAKSIFLANMSHEIRTPLNGVLGMAEALKEMNLPNEQSDMVQTIVSSGNMLLTVLNDVLDVSKIEAGQLEIEQIPFNVQDLIETTRQLYILKTQEKGLEFQTRIDPGVSEWIESDPTRIRQVLGNLISNAIKFTDKGKIQLHLSQVKQKGQIYLALKVKDTGTGIPQEKLADLGKPFQQVDASISRTHGGTGLGLTICKQICGLMGGTLEIESKQGKGSIFTAKIRVKPTHAPSKNSTISNNNWWEIIGKEPRKILVAEDNKTNQLVLSKQLKDLPINITFAQNGLEAVSAFKSGRYDVVFMDINMPLMGGIEAVEKIRAYETGLGIIPTPIVALTANSMRHQVEAYLEAGMDAHLAKPIKKQDVLKLLAEFLSNHLN